MVIFFCKKKHREDKPETNKTDYVQWVLGEAEEIGKE